MTEGRQGNMDISLRLKTIAKMVDKCNSVADIGTDHGYIPIYLVKNKLCNKVIASDINKGPVEKAKFNINLEGMNDTIECRLAAGLKAIRPKEVSSFIVAGMGGNLIRDIIEEDLEVFKNVDYAILQPVQNPEVLRKYLIEKGYQIINEEICLDENKYYEIIKVRYDNKPKILDYIYYLIGEKLIEKKHVLLKDYINYKIENYNKIYSCIKENTELALSRKFEIENNIRELKELLRCL